MYWDVITVRALANYQIFVELADGRTGVFDMSPYLEKGLFKELKNISYFNQVGIQYGAVTWPNEQDISPDTLVSALNWL
jgi:Protein of unknown function (DUF2442)